MIKIFFQNIKKICFFEKNSFMISILIPVYNFDVRKLVYEINKQTKNKKIDFEIILIDDKSKKIFVEKNRELKNLESVIYIELQKNIGRSKIRNLLAEKSKFEYLIFMDCDSEIENDNFIKNYLKFCKNEIIIYGGLNYKKKPPIDKKKYFRWFYGIKREVISSEIRKQNSNKSFKTSNFLIHKNIFNKIKFDEKIKTYGHEDTIFGFELKKQNIKIIHIDNPLIHIGLEDNEVFLEKTKEAIENLKYISDKFHNENELFNDIKILKYYKIIKKLKIKFFIILIFLIFKNLIIKNLKSQKPNLKLFDFYKIYFILK